jgi:hypothetical protein
MDREPVERAMRAAGLQVIENGLVDSPPWPGFDALRPLGALLRRHTVQSVDAPVRSEADVESMLQRFTFIEYGPLPNVVKLPFTHQLYVIGRKSARRA